VVLDALEELDELEELDALVEPAEPVLAELVVVASVPPPHAVMSIRDGSVSNMNVLREVCLFGWFMATVFQLVVFAKLPERGAV
jgi:hypothetical protein